MLNLHRVGLANWVRQSFLSLCQLRLASWTNNNSCLTYTKQAQPIGLVINRPQSMLSRLCQLSQRPTQPQPIKQASPNELMATKLGAANSRQVDLTNWAYLDLNFKLHLSIRLIRRPSLSVFKSLKTTLYGDTQDKHDLNQYPIDKHMTHSKKSSIKKNSCMT